VSELADLLDELPPESRLDNAAAAAWLYPVGRLPTAWLPLPESFDQVRLVTRAGGRVLWPAHPFVTLRVYRAALARLREARAPHGGAITASEREMLWRFAANAWQPGEPAAGSTVQAVAAPDGALERGLSHDQELCRRRELYAASWAVLNAVCDLVEEDR
jgi:hypothetical protein